MLSNPTIEQILEETDFKLVCGKDYLEQYISSVIVGAMQPHDAIKYVVDDSLMITPGDREDMIMTALGCFRDTDEKRLKVSGIILTGGILPGEPIKELLTKARIPVLLAKDDTYNVATSVHDLTVKIRPQDTFKIEAAIKLIKNYTNLDDILKGM
jgi:BioD-like phosphotransacetylase family protein